VGGSPAGTVAATRDDAWRAAFESIFLGAVRLARVLAADLAGEGESGAGTVTGPLSGTGGSIAFVLAASVCAPLPGVAISNGLFPCLAGVVKTLADEHGPSGIRINGLLPVRIATERIRQLDALSADPDVPPRRSMSWTTSPPCRDHRFVLEQPSSAGHERSGVVSMQLHEA
jgi:3-oxoacyl-[acyl-carrier protein] reductase